MAGFLDKIRGAFGGKKGSREQEDDQLSFYEKYGVREEDFQVNPLFGQNTEENEFYNPLHGMDLGEPEAEQKQEPEEVLLPKANFWENIAGMPTKATIEEMAGGAKLWKMWKYRNFANALNALEEYQRIMQESHTVTMNEAKLRRSARTVSEDAELNLGTESAGGAFNAIKQFVLYAENAIKNTDGLFARNSNNVRKLKPVFANLLVQAYTLLPKLARLENEVAPYVITTDQETYTYADVLNHQITAGRSGGYAMKGAEENHGTVDLNPELALEALKGEDSETKIAELRREATGQSHLNMVIPPLPFGAEDAEAAADRYIEDIRFLMRALDDTTESYEGGGAKDDRLEIHGKQAEHFRLSKVFYHAIKNKAALTAVIKNGIREHMTQEEQSVAVLAGYSGMTLSQGLAMINQEARDTTKFRRLVDKSGNALTEGKTGYVVGGGGASIAIIDHVNNKVLRAPKESGKYLSKEEQNKAVNGIHDEAIAKVGQFLGFHVIANAEATGFMAKESKKSEEHAVFGGSVMDKVQGTDARNINFLLRDGKNANDVNVLKNGRLINEILQMNVVDYLMAHADRHDGNFLVDLNADKDSSMVTGIDNDMILGVAASSTERTGFESSEEALLGIKSRSELGYSIKLHASFPMMPQNIKDAIDGIDLKKLDELLMPYTDRLSRIAVLQRAKELKEVAKDIKICDLESEDGIREYLKESGKIALTDAIKRSQMTSHGLTADTQRITNLIVRMLVFSNMKSKFLSEQTVVSVCKMLGLSKQEAMDLVRENISTTREGDEKMEDQKFEKTELGKLLERYDSLKPEELDFKDKENIPLL